jgi:plasmid replication initiation protein
MEVEILEVSKNIKDNPVVKKNILNSAKFDLTLMEYRIILAALSKIKPNNVDIPKVEFSVQEFNSIYYDNKLNFKNYTVLRKACQRLLSRTIVLENEIYLKGFQWVSLIEYFKDKGKIIVRFHDELKPFILFLKENYEYTKYMLSNISRMNSYYSVRIYELLKQYETIGFREFKLDNLKDILGINKNKYKLYTNFKKTIVDVAQNELIEKSDIYFTFELVKEARKVIGIKFYIHKNTSQNREFIKNNKFDLIAKCNNLLAERLTIRLNTSYLESYHRIVIIDLIIMLRNANNFNSIIHPSNFIEAKLKEFTKRYDLTKVQDY